MGPLVPLPKQLTPPPVSEVSTDAQLGQLNFVRAKHFTRPTDRVVSGMPEVVRVVHIRTNLRCEELRGIRRILCPSVTVQPREICKREWFGMRIARVCRSSLLGRNRWLGNGWLARHSVLCFNRRGVALSRVRNLLFQGFNPPLKVLYRHKRGIKSK